MIKTIQDELNWFQSDNLKWVGIVALVVTFVTCGSVAMAQQSSKVFRIGYLDPGTASGSAVLLDIFRQELSSLGWVEGKNIRIEYRFAEQKRERLSDLAAELVHLGVNVIVITGGPAGLAAKRATSTVPIVMANVGDPVGEGLVVSLARPGGNITGLSALSTELNTKRLEILKDTIPSLTRVGVLQQPRGGTGLELQIKELRAAARALKLKLEEIETPIDPTSLETAFQTARQQQANAVMTLTSRELFSERTKIVALADKYRLPAIYFQKEFVDDGGLMSYGVDFADLYRHAAVYVDKILKGAKPADLPVQQATKFQFVINLKAAKRIGLTIPPQLLAKADRVIR